MATSNNISALVENQFPSFVKSNGPKLVSFMKAYYEWMETSGQATERFKNLSQYQDIDSTLDTFVQYFGKEVLGAIPQTTLSNKKLLAKHARDLYRARGSEESFKLLFRILYDEDIELYYPGDNILRASDGRWILDKSIRVSSPKTGTISSLVNQQITGATSGATARIDRVSSTTERGLLVDELFITNISGTFVDGELIRNSSNSVNATIFNISGPINVVTIIGGGSGHQSGDAVNLTGQSGGGSGANATVLTVSDTSALTFRLVKGGHGYRANSTVTITSVGIGGNFNIASLSNTEQISINQDQISAVKDCVINTYPYFISSGANTATVSANLAIANVSVTLGSALAFSNVVVGTINTISTIDPGYGYTSIPTVQVQDNEISQLELVAPGGGFKGNNAVVVANNALGSILSLTINIRGQNYSQYELVDIANQTRTAFDANGSVSVTGVVEYPGRYDGTHGFLSWDHKLQDNLYYQEFSYVIKAMESLKSYASIVKKSVHPAGTKMFGEVVTTSTLAPNTVTMAVTTLTTA